MPEVFPTSSTGSDPVSYSASIRFYTVTTQHRTGEETAERIWKFPRYTWKLSYRLSISDAETYLNFFERHYGAHLEFDYYDYISREWTNQFVGIGDGTTTDFELPGPFIVPTVYVDGVLQIWGAAADYNFTFLGGTNQRTVLEFNAGSIPAAGSLITIDFTGNRLTRCKFGRDLLAYQIERTLFNSEKVTNFDFELIGLRGY